jgi:hypothetical protein
MLTTCGLQANRAKVYFLTGNVNVNHQPAQIDQEIINGSIIETGKNSLCEIIFNEKNAIRLKENSNIIFDFTKIEMSSGSMIGVFKKLSKSDKSFSIKTPHNLAAIRGTSFFVKIENKNSTYFCDCNGVITISDLNNSMKHDLRTAHHSAVHITKKGQKTNITKAKMKYHSDKDVEKAASCISYKIDWNKVAE